MTAIPPMLTEPPKTVTAIRVRALWFPKEQTLPLLKNGGGQRVIVAGKDPKDDALVIQIQYEPWQRMFRIREIHDGVVRNEFCLSEVGTVYFPEGAACSSIPGG
jgi:hypothetical protein